MKILDYIMDEIYDEMPDMDFSSIIRESRDRLGLMQYRTAEFLGMKLGRLKNLETGYFRKMPKEEEVKEICDFFEFPFDMMWDKAKKHIDDRALQTKVRIIADGSKAM